MSKKTALLLLVILMTLGLAACGSSNEDKDEPEGVVSVYGSGQESTPGLAADVEAAPDPEMGGLRELHVSFTRLKLRKTNGDAVTVFDSDSGTGTIDLVEAWNNPSLVGTLNIPVGDYDGISEGRVSLIEITDDEGETCTVMEDDELEFGPVIMKGSITVDDTGVVGVDVVIPVISGECDPETGVGTISFGSVWMTPHLED